MTNITVKVKSLLAISTVLIFRFLSKFMGEHKHWVISERGIDARDNGYHFYKYMKAEHPERKIFYIIDKKSIDYSKVKENAIEYGSIASYFIIFSAERIISTHYAQIISNLPWKYFSLSGLQKKFYFLQHGIIMHKLEMLFAQSAPMKLFVCGAKPEYEYVAKYFGHSDNVVKYTGLARFDNLHKYTLKRQILVMPTWRMSYGAEFINSQYFKEWNNLLKDSRLQSILEENDITLIFYPHFRVQEYLDFFQASSKNIIIASFNDYDVQNLLKESMLLITDYSSVHFDFAYMKKPIVYFQFDNDAFFRKHHCRKGYFDYEKMGFGKVCFSSEEVIDQVSELIENKFMMSSYYIRKAEEFFPLYDSYNCKRIYDEIIATKQEEKIWRK